jgi:hypothetical protein
MNRCKRADKARVFVLGGRFRSAPPCVQAGADETMDLLKGAGMTEQILIVDEIVLVRWRAMTSGGVQRGLAAIDEVCASGVIPVFIGMVGDGVSPPTGETNRALVGAIDSARLRCSSVNLVLDGRGLTSAAIRAGATAMFLLKGDRRTKMYPSLDDVLADRVRDRVEPVLNAAAHAGLLTPVLAQRSA